jgi:hypothetical protein
MAKSVFKSAFKWASISERAEAVRPKMSDCAYGLGPEVLTRPVVFHPGIPSGPPATHRAGKTSLLRLLFLSLRPDLRAGRPVRATTSLLKKDQVADCAKRIASCCRISGCSTAAT